MNTKSYSYEVDLARGMFRPLYGVMLGAGDVNADTFNIHIIGSADTLNISGASVKGYFQRADGATVYIDGTLADGVASVVLPESCYAYSGPFGLAVKLEDADNAITIAYVNGSVVQTTTGYIVDPGTLSPSIDEILAELADKIDEPAEEGNDGDILTTDGNGGRAWVNPTASTVAGSVEIDGTAYPWRTGDAGAAGYITLVLEGE